MKQSYNKMDKNENLDNSIYDHLKTVKNNAMIS